jgi:hypothetical protein
MSLLECFLNIFLKVSHPDSAKAAASSYLFSLFVVDNIQWAIGKLVRQEIVKIGMEVNISEVKTTLALSTVDTYISFLANIILPFMAVALFKAPTRIDNLNTQQLAKTAYTMYFASAALAVICYSISCSIVFGAKFEPSTAFIVTMSIVWAIQYPFANQLGDQSVDMGLPNWARTFEGCTLRFMNWACCCECRWVPAVPSNSRTLSLYATLVKGCWMACAVSIYSVVSGSPESRWAFTLILSFFSFASLGQSLLQSSVLEKAIVNPELSCDRDTPIQAGKHVLEPLPRVDLSLIAFAVLVLELPKTTYDAITSALDIRFSGGYELNVLAVLGTLVFIANLLHSITKSDLDRATNKKPRAGIFSEWLVLLWAMIILLGATTWCLFAETDIGNYISLPLLLVYTVLTQSMKARFVGHLFLHPEERGTRVQYWIAISKILIVGPVNALSWIVPNYVKDGDSTALQLAIVMSSTVVIFLIVGIWYSFFEPRWEANGLNSFISSCAVANKASATLVPELVQPASIDSNVNTSGPASVEIIDSEGKS